MRDLLVLLAHLLTTVARLLGPGGARAVVAESVLMKQQFSVINRSRRRAPDLSAADRLLLGFWSLFLNPRRILRAALIIRPSTLRKFHDVLKKRKYRLLFSPSRRAKPGPKGPSQELIQMIVELKRSNPRFGSPRIALIVILFWNADDLERKLTQFRVYYNEYRVHGSIGGPTPAHFSGERVNRRAALHHYRWETHCRDLYQLPVAA